MEKVITEKPLDIESPMLGCSPPARI